MGLLELRGAGCTYPNGTEAVKGLDLTLGGGDLVGLIGPDGAGKTTAFRMMMALQRPTCGEIVRSVGKHLMGYVPQVFSLTPELTVAENMALQAKLYGLKHPETRIRELLVSVDLEAFLDRQAGALSGGMKQKLALCVALLPRPRLLMLDEPTTGVDPVSRREFWSLLHGVADDGVAILFSTPYMDEAEYAHRMLLMHEGRVLAQGTLDGFRAELGGQVVRLITRRFRDVLAGLGPMEPLETFAEGEVIRARFPVQPLAPLLMRLRAIPGVEDAQAAEATLEDCFLARLKEAGRDADG